MICPRDTWVGMCCAVFRLPPDPLLKWMHKTAACPCHDNEAKDDRERQHEQDTLMCAGRSLMRKRGISRDHACQRCLLFMFCKQQEANEKADQAHDHPTYKDTQAAYVEFLKLVLSEGGWQ